MAGTDSNALNFTAAVQLCGGKEDIAREIIQMLVNELPEQNKMLQSAYEQQDWQQLDYLTHKLSGSASYCGMDQIKMYSHTLNRSIRQRDLEQVPTQFTQLHLAIDSALNAAAALNIKPQG